MQWQRGTECCGEKLEDGYWDFSFCRGDLGGFISQLCAHSAQEGSVCWKISCCRQDRQHRASPPCPVPIPSCIPVPPAPPGWCQSELRKVPTASPRGFAVVLYKNKSLHLCLNNYSGVSHGVSRNKGASTCSRALGRREELCFTQHPRF